MSAPKSDVEKYLAALPGETRATLEKLRKTIKSAAPKADEVISYRVPTFKYRGRPLVAYAAFKDHCSFLVMSSTVLKAHKDDVKGYHTATGTIRFPIRGSLPAALVKKLVKARIAENEAGASK